MAGEGGLEGWEDELEGCEGPERWEGLDGSIAVGSEWVMCGYIRGWADG